MPGYSRKKPARQDKLKKAVALAYDADVNNAPLVVASGSGYIAEKIVETADKAGIPVYQDDTAATLLTQLELGQEIPFELYEVVAQIFTYVIKTSDDIKSRRSVQK